MRRIETKMDNTAAGINEGNLAILAIDIIKYKDRISELFSKIDGCFDALPNSFQSEACNDIVKSYSELRQNYGIVKENIQNYADDLNALIQMMKNNDTKLSNLFQEFISENNGKKLNTQLNIEDK